MLLHSLAPSETASNPVLISCSKSGRHEVLINLWATLRCRRSRMRQRPGPGSRTGVTTASQRQRRPPRRSQRRPAASLEVQTASTSPEPNEQPALRSAPHCSTRAHSSLLKRAAGACGLTNCGLFCAVQASSGRGSSSSSSRTTSSPTRQNGRSSSRCGAESRVS